MAVRVDDEINTVLIWGPSSETFLDLAVYTTTDTVTMKKAKQ